MPPDATLPAEDDDQVTLSEPEVTAEPQGEQADLAPEPPKDKEPDGYVRAINKKHFEMMEAKRANEALQQELDRIKAQMPQATRPVIPELPDPYDEGYAQQVAARDEAIRQAAAYDARQQAQTERQQEAAKLKQDEQNKALQERSKTYFNRAAELKVPEAEVKAAGGLLVSYGVQPDLLEYILDNDKGPLITTHLARHPEQLEALRGMSPVAAAVHIETTIKPQAVSGLKTAPPPPPDNLSGGGAPPADEGPAGATYE